MGQRFFRPRRLGHVNLYVADLEKSMAFYTKVVGIEETYRTPLGGGGFVGNGNTHHDVGFTEAFGPLGKPRNARPGEPSHIAFELENEVELVQAYERATAAGIEFLRTVDHDIAHSVYGRAPDGVVYELYADVIKDWRTHRTGIVTKPKPSWKPGMTEPVNEPCYHVDPEIRQVPDAIFHVERTTHAVLAVSDLPAALEYYRTVVGLDADPAGAGLPFAVLKGSVAERTIVLVPAAATGRAGYHSVAMRVASAADLDASVAKARKAGIPIHADVSNAGRRAVLLRDPDGCLVRLYADEAGEPALENIDPALALYIA